MSAAEVQQNENIIEKNALGIEYSVASQIGLRLKEARESYGLSKEFVAKKAKIRERYIDAIELGDWDILPPGLNGRGLIRLYAKELVVSLPEFEGFSHLQTIQAEKQSESLSQTNNFSKKSRYQPAAEESAEIIKIVPRSQYKGQSAESHFPILPSTPRENSVFNQAKSYQSKTHSTAAIVTPKISEIVGIDMGYMNQISVPLSSQPDIPKVNIEISEGRGFENSVLPLAKPVAFQAPKKKEEKLIPEIEEVPQYRENLPIQAKEQVEEKNVSEPESIALAAEEKIVKQNKTENLSEEVNHLKKQIPWKQIALYASMLVAVGAIVEGVLTLTRREEAKVVSQESTHAITVRNKVTENPSKAAQPLAAPVSTTVAPVPVIERKAKIDILARVKLQIEADGKEIFSGYHQPGQLDITFTNKADLLVYDASKVKLTYGTWEHGELGWNERKRKITLNAKDYEE